MEMAVLEGKLHDTAAALAALEKKREEQKLQKAAEEELAQAMKDDARWKEIQEQQESAERILKAEIEEQKNRSAAERTEFEKMLKNKTDVERLKLEAEFNKIETERQRVQQEKMALQEQHRLAVEQFKTSESQRLEHERLRNKTEAERRRIEAEKNETALQVFHVRGSMCVRWALLLVIDVKKLNGMGVGDVAAEANGSTEEGAWGDEKQARKGPECKNGGAGELGL
jgi:hypothetical protein